MIPGVKFKIVTKLIKVSQLPNFGVSCFFLQKYTNHHGCGIFSESPGYEYIKVHNLISVSTLKFWGWLGFFKKYTKHHGCGIFSESQKCAPSLCESFSDWFMHFCCELSFVAITRFLGGTFGQNLIGGGSKIVTLYISVSSYILPSYILHRWDRILVWPQVVCLNHSFIHFSLVSLSSLSK